MTSYDSLVEKLREELKHEALSRQLQEEVNSKLQDEYDVLLKRLAEAESHIDRLRFCSDLELNKHFLIRHQTEQHATLRQRLTAWLDPVTASHQQTGEVATGESNHNYTLKSTGVGTDNTSPFRDEVSDNHDNSTSSDQVKGASHSPNLSENSNFDASSPLRNSPTEAQNSIHNNSDTESVEPTDGHYVPLSPHVVNSTINGSGQQENGGDSRSRDVVNSSNNYSRQSGSDDGSVISLDSSNSMYFAQSRRGENDFKVHRNAPSESQERLIHSSSSNNSFLHSLSPTRPQIINSSRYHTPSSFADTDDTSISQMSSSAAENRSCAESMQLANLFKVHSLQEELSDLKSKLNDRSIPIDKIIDKLGQIHGEHEQLARDVQTSSAQLDALGSRKHDGKVPHRLAMSKNAIGNELANLAGQLQELYELVNARAKREGALDEESVEDEHKLLPSMNPSEAMLEKKDSDSRLSSTFYDSLNSPHLPAKYFNQDTSTDNQYQSPQGSPRQTNSVRSPTPSTLPPCHSTSHGSNADDQHQSLQGFPHQTTRIISPSPSINPPCQSTPHRSSSYSTLSDGSGPRQSSEQQLPLNDVSSSARSDTDRHVFENHGKSIHDRESTRNQRVGQRDLNDSSQMEQPVDLAASENHKGGFTPGGQTSNDTLSDISDIVLSDEELQLPNETTLSSNESSDQLEGRDINLMCSPDSYYLQQAKRNLKRAKKLGYCRGNVEHNHGQGSTTSSNGRKNTQTSPSKIPRLTQSCHGPRLQSPNSVSPRQQKQQNSSDGVSKKDLHSCHLTFPGEADSGFAGSEFPSRTATRMESSSPPVRGRRLQNNVFASSVLQSSSTCNEDDINRQRFEEATAAIECLRMELAGLKEQMMRNVKQQNEKMSKRHDSIPGTPSSHSHSHSSMAPSSSLVTKSSHEHPLASCRQKRQSNGRCEHSPVSQSPLHNAPSGHNLGSEQSSNTCTLPATSSLSTVSLSHQSLIGEQPASLFSSHTTKPLVAASGNHNTGEQLKPSTVESPAVATPSQLLVSSHRAHTDGLLSRPTNTTKFSTPAHSPRHNVHADGQSLPLSSTPLISTPSISLKSGHTISGEQALRPITTDNVPTPVHSLPSLHHTGKPLPPTSTALISTPSRSLQSASRYTAPAEQLLQSRTSTGKVSTPLASPHHTVIDRRSLQQSSSTALNVKATPSRSSLASLHKAVSGAQSLRSTTTDKVDVSTPVHSLATLAGVQPSRVLDATPVHSLKPTPFARPTSSGRTAQRSSKSTAAVKETMADKHSPSSSPTTSAVSLGHSTPALSAHSMDNTPLPTPCKQPAILSHTNTTAQLKSNVYGGYFGSNPSSTNVCVSDFTPSNDLLEGGSSNENFPASWKQGSRYSTHHHNHHLVQPTRSSGFSIPSSRINSFDNRSSLGNEDRPSSYHSDIKPDVCGVHQHTRSDGPLCHHFGNVERHKCDNVHVATWTGSNRAICGSTYSSTLHSPANSLAVEIESGMTDSLCPSCSERAKRDHHDNRRFSDDFVSHQSSASLSSCSPASLGKGQTQNRFHPKIKDINHYQLAQGDDSVRRQSPCDVQARPERHMGGGDFSAKSTSINVNRAQRPVATSTPSRRRAELNSRRMQTQTPYREVAQGRETLMEESVTLPQGMGKTEHFAAPSLRNNVKAKQSVSKASNESSPVRVRHSSDFPSCFPKRRRNDEMYATSTHSSPACSRVRGSDSDTYSSAHSSSALRYSEVRRASSPVLSTNIHSSVRSRREPTINYRHTTDRERLAYLTPLPSDSSTDSESSYHERGTPSRRTGSLDDVITPHAHIHTSSKRASNRVGKPLREHVHYSKPDSGLEHLHIYVHGHGDAKPQVVKVVEAPKIKKKRVVYLTSRTPSPREEVQFSVEPGRFTPRASSQRKRVAGIAEGIGGTSAARRRSIDRSYVSGVSRVSGHGRRKKRVYLEPTSSSPEKKVYLVEQSSDGTDSDPEQFGILETCDLDLEDTLRLANELKRRTRRLKGTLQAELGRQRYH